MKKSMENATPAFSVGMSMIGDRFLPKNMKHQIWKAQPMEGAAGDRNRLGFPALT